MSGLRRNGLVVLASMALGAASLAAQVVNGGFETNGGAGTNTFAGWTVVDQAGGAGSWYAQTGTGSPLNGFPVPAPPEGVFAAMTDTVNPGSHVLYQDIVVPSTGGQLSFGFTLSNQAAGFISPPTLDYTAGPNQQFRVDVMNPGAPVTDVGAGVLLNVFQTNPGDLLVSPYEYVTASLSAFAGQTVRLRFAEVDNQLFFNAGVDNVQVGQSIPTLSFPMLASLGVLLAAGAAWKLRAM